MLSTSDFTVGDIIIDEDRLTLVLAMSIRNEEERLNTMYVMEESGYVHWSCIVCGDVYGMALADPNKGEWYDAR